jgi:hypothetical protein
MAPASYRTVRGERAAGAALRAVATRPFGTIKMAAAAVLAIGLGAVVAAVGAGGEAASGSRWVGGIDSPEPVSGAAVAAAAVHAGEVTLMAQLQRLDQEVRALRERHEHLAARVRALESGPAGEPKLAAALDGVDVARAVSVSLLLREATQSSRPFADELGAFAVLASDPAQASFGPDRRAVIEQIAVLRSHAETGMATRRDLRRSFPAVAQAIERARPLAWWESLLALIRLREHPLAGVREAEEALLLDDLRSAVDGLAMLDGEPALAAEGWMRLARARLAIDDAVAGLYRSTLTAGAPPVSLALEATPAGRTSGLRAEAASIDLD